MKFAIHLVILLCFCIGSNAYAGFITSGGKEILTKIKTVDGSGSGLDADTIDNEEFSAANVLSKLLTVDGSASLLDADTLDSYNVVLTPTNSTIPLRNNAGELGGIGYSYGATNPTGVNTITFDFLPTWTRHVRIVVYNVSSTAVSTLTFTLGDSGGAELTGYINENMITVNCAQVGLVAATDSITGVIEFDRLGVGVNSWVVNSTFNVYGEGVIRNIGWKTTSAETDRITMKWTSGNFDTATSIINAYYY